MNNGVKPLKYYRDLDGATLLDDNDRFYREGEREGERVYGYRAHFSGSYICYTCGHLCDCGEDNE